MAAGVVYGRLVDHVVRQGLRLPVADHGPADGPGVVLLHGFPQTARCWEAVIPPLVVGGLRVLAPDQRGYTPGARPHGRRRYVLDELADDVLAVAEGAGLDRFHVVGHDWGAIVAWHLAMHHPDRLASVTALSVPHPLAMARALGRSDQLLRSWYVAAVQIPRLPEAVLGVAAGAVTRRILAASGMPADHARRSAELLAQPGAATATLNWYRALPLAAVSPRRPRRVTVPTLYLWSTADRFLGRAAAEACGRFVDGAYRLQVLHGVSHWIPETAPDDVARLVLGHVRSHPA